MHVAVVESCGEVRHVAVDASREGLVGQLACYVEARAPHTLWPEDAEQVGRLLAAGRGEEAVAWYFARVGHRWDPERLVVERVATPARP